MTFFIYQILISTGALSNTIKTNNAIEFHEESLYQSGIFFALHITESK